MKKILNNITNKLLIDLAFSIPLLLFFFMNFNFNLKLESSNNFEKYGIYPLIGFGLLILSVLDHGFFKLIYIKSKTNILNYRFKSKISTHKDVLSLTIILIFLSLLFFNLLLLLHFPFNAYGKTNLILPIAITLIFLMFTHFTTYYSYSASKWKFKKFSFWKTQKKRKIKFLIALLIFISILTGILTSVGAYYFLPDFYHYPNKLFTSSSNPHPFFENTLGGQNAVFGELITSLLVVGTVTNVCFMFYEYKNKHLFILSLVTLNIILLIYAIVEWKKQNNKGENVNKTTT